MNPAQAKAVAITNAILNKLTVQAGQRENDVAAWIKSELKKAGARPSFRIIVASGKRAARPHGYATGKRIKKGELVVVDFGAVFKGQRSDVTRTFIIGRPTRKQKRIYNIVKQAQLRAIKTVRAGVRCDAVDRSARSYIERRGFGKYFIHTTGHGIGKKVHQAPKISRQNPHRLAAGRVITIEPGIYIKGWGGVRIEDMLLVTERRQKLLTNG